MCLEWEGRGGAGRVEGRGEERGEGRGEERGRGGERRGGGKGRGEEREKCNKIMILSNLFSIQWVG